LSQIKELFFKEASLENRNVTKSDMVKFLDYINSAGDEGSQFDAKDIGKILDKNERICLDKVKNQLGKHLSAFANTSGGLLAIGIKENKRKRVAFTANNYPLSRVNLQHLQRAISTSLEPKIEFYVELVEMERAKSAAKGIILIFIEQSMTPPHQVINNRTYYFRHGESSNPAPHSLVSALFRFRKKPNLKIDVIKVRSSENLRVIIKNKGNSPALHTHIVINIYPILIKGNHIQLNTNVIDKTTDGLWNIKEFLGNSKQNFMKFRFRAKPEQIILPGVNEVLFDLPFQKFPEAKLNARLYCDDFEGEQEFKLF